MPATGAWTRIGRRIIGLVGAIQFLLGALYMVGALVAPFGTRAEHATLALLVAVLAMATAVPVMSSYRYANRKVWAFGALSHAALLACFIGLLGNLDDLAAGQVFAFAIMVICLVSHVAQRPVSLTPIFE